MTIKEKMLQIITLAMSIKATDSYYLSIDWSNNTNHINIYVFKHINAEPQEIVESYTYDGTRDYDSCVSYETMTDRLNRMKREWGEV